MLLIFFLFFNAFSEVECSPAQPRLRESNSPGPQAQTAKKKRTRSKEHVIFIFFNEPIDSTQSLDSLFPGLLIEDDTIYRIQVKRFGGGRF